MNCNCLMAFKGEPTNSTSFLPSSQLSEPDRVCMRRACPHDLRLCLSQFIVQPVEKKF